MDFAVQSTLAVVRATQTATAPPAAAETLRSARMGSVAPGLQVAALAEPSRVQDDRQRQPDDERGRVAPLQPVASLSDGPGNRYRYKVAHAPDLDRPLLQIVDGKTDQIMISLPPEQLVRMLEDAMALVDDRLKDPHARHLDMTA